MKHLRPYQVSKSEEAGKILQEKGLVYIAAEVRTGKTAMSLNIAKTLGFKKVLCLTKKKAIGEFVEMDSKLNEGIIGDYYDFGFDKHFELIVINDESMHKVDEPESFDLVIHDEHHRFGSAPTPGKATKMYRSLFVNKPQVWLSGTPSPETYSQLYHQFWVTMKGPWTMYKNFYAWAKDYVDVKQKYISASHKVNDYSIGIESKILPDIKPYIVTLTQKEAGFKAKINEEILHVQMKPLTYTLCQTLLKDLVIEGKDEVILGDTPAKLRSKIHQMFSGTVKFESGESMVLDTTKAEFILERFKGLKVAIFYKFQAEYECLKRIIGDNLTDDISEFNANPEKWIALQVQSGREGTNLSAADCLVFYNIDDAALSYWQARDRMTVMSREENNVFWIFAKGGIEEKIYRIVTTKKANYTKRYFFDDFKPSKPDEAWVNRNLDMFIKHGVKSIKVGKDTINLDRS